MGKADIFKTQHEHGQVFEPKGYHYLTGKTNISFREGRICFDGFSHKYTNQFAANGDKNRPQSGSTAHRYSCDLIKRPSLSGVRL